METKLSDRIRAARIYAGMSRAQLAAAIELSVETIARYERGQQNPRGLAGIQVIAEATGVPVWFLKRGFGPEDAP